MRRRILSLGQRLMVAAGPGPRAYEAMAGVLARHLRRGRPEVSVYLRGGLAHGEVTPGLSDIDLLVASPADPGSPGARRSELMERWRRVGRLVPPLRKLAGAVVYEEDVLQAVVREDALVFGLDRGDTLYCGPGRPVPDDIGLSYRPGLHGASGWRRLGGPDRRPPAGDRDAALRAAWMEVQVCWRYAFEAIAHASDVSELYRAYLWPKLTADLARVWLWVARAERAVTRAAALEAAAEALESDREQLLGVRELLAHPGGSPERLAEQLLPLILRLTALVAEELSGHAAQAGATDVRLLGDSSGPALPLMDWRGVVVPHPDQRFSPVSGDPADPSALRRAYTGAGVYGALRSGGLVVMPSSWTRGILRAVSFGATDPVTAALLEGESTARFPLLPGWSARDWARRGVAEHRAWLEHGGAHQPGSGERLALLLNAARPALLLESLDRGDGELALTPRAAAERLADLDIEVGRPLLAACDGDGDIAAVEAALRGLPSYAASPAPAVAT